MTCRECRDLLSALIDRELSAEELKKIRAHLNKCAQCSEECAQLCCMHAATKLACCLQVPARLWERVRSAMTACCAPRSQTGEPDALLADIFTPEEAASYLRLSLSELVASLDAIPHFRIGEHIRFRRSMLVQWIQAQEEKES